MKRLMLFGLLAGALVTCTGCGLFQGIFCYRPCTMRGDCGGCCGDCGDEGCGPACGPRCGARGWVAGPGTPESTPTAATIAVRTGAGRGAGARVAALRQLRHVRRLRLRWVRGSVRRLLLRPALAPWSAELPVCPIYSRLLVRTRLRRALIGAISTPTRLIAGTRATATATTRAAAAIAAEATATDIRAVGPLRSCPPTRRTSFRRAIR